MDMPKELLFTILDTIDIGLYVLDHKGNFLYVNQTFANMCGFPKEAFWGRNATEKSPYYKNSVSEIVYRQKKKAVMFQDMTFLDRPEAYPNTYRMITTSTPILDEQGNVKNIIATAEPFYLINGKYQTAKANQHIDTFLNQTTVQNQNLVAESPAMAHIIKTLDHVANTDSTVLIQGESGTGKDVLARYLHDQSTRKESPFIEVNCAAIPENLLESELFGYEKGAFTGALTQGKKGLLTLAKGGTLFLNEINSMPLALQGKLLRVLETKKIRPLGASYEIPVDFRLVCASNQDLMTLCKKGAFREDLYYRIHVVPITVPALRQRKEDIIPLINLFLKEFCTQYQQTKSLSHRVIQQLLAYQWPGNIRQLRNFIERLVVTSEDSANPLQKLPEDFLYETAVSSPAYSTSGTFIFIDSPEGLSRQKSEDFSLKQCLESYEKEILESVLSVCESTYQAAKLLKISQPSVVRKKQKYRIP